MLIRQRDLDLFKAVAEGSKSPEYMRAVLFDFVNNTVGILGIDVCALSCEPEDFKPTHMVLVETLLAGTKATPARDDRGVLKTVMRVTPEGVSYNVLPTKNEKIDEDCNEVLDGEPLLEDSIKCCSPYMDMIEALLADLTCTSEQVPPTSYTFSKKIVKASTNLLKAAAVDWCSIDTYASGHMTISAGNYKIFATGLRK